MNARPLIDRITSAPGRIVRGWRAFPRVIAWGIVIGAWVALGVGYGWPQDYRSASRAYVAVAWIGFLARALQFYIGIAMVPIAMVAAFVTGRRLFLAALPPLVIGLWPCASEIVFRPDPPAISNRPQFRLMTANVLCSNGETERFLKVVKDAKPDVIVMQEYTPWWRGKSQLALSFDYPYEAGFPEEDASGIAICSKFPFKGDVRSDIAPGLDGRRVLRAVVSVGDQDIAIYTAHPESPRSIDRYRAQNATFSQLREALALETLPCVLAGDMNFTETTPQHRDLLKLGFTEAQAAVGRGRGSTWPMDWTVTPIVGIRLDHVYAGNGLVPIRCDVLDPGASDHRPVVIDLAVEGGR